NDAPAGHGIEQRPTEGEWSGEVDVEVTHAQDLDKDFGSQDTEELELLQIVVVLVQDVLFEGLFRQALHVAVGCLSTTHDEEHDVWIRFIDPLCNFHEDVESSKHLQSTRHVRHD